MDNLDLRALSNKGDLQSWNRIRSRSEGRLRGLLADLRHTEDLISETNIDLENIDAILRAIKEEDKNG